MPDLNLQDIRFFAVEGATIDEATVTENAGKVKREIASAISTVRDRHYQHAPGW
jgi:hypothetical protein